MKQYFLLLIGILGSAEMLRADKPDSEPYQNQWVILPVAGYTPETSLLLGGLAMHQFKPGRAGEETRSSNFIFSAAYTLNRQLLLELTPNVIFRKETLILDGRYEYSFFPDSYWGVGAHLPDETETDIEYRQYEFRQAALFRVVPELHAGPIIRWSRLTDITFPDGFDWLPGPSDTEISEGSRLYGAGFSIRHDRRNSLITPTENYYFEFTGIIYPEFIGNTHPHSSWLADVRSYLDLFGDQTSVLAFHFRSHFTAGSPPFQEYALLGGREIMRGYYEGRFRDNNALQLQAEYRRHIYWRFGATLFAAAGEVWNRFEEISFTNPKLSAGAGLRFNLNPDDTMNLRIDYGISPHGSGLYITIGEAF